MGDVGPAPTPERLILVVGLKREAALLAGLGEIHVGTARLADALAQGPARVLSFGLAGGLDPDLAAGDLVLGASVTADDGEIAADPDWLNRLLAQLPDARAAAVAGSDVIAATPAAKAALRARTGAAVVDMESHAVARAARAAGAPFAVLRAVADPALRALPRAAQAGFGAEGEDVGAVLRALARRPWELTALIRTALDAAAGETTLRQAAACLRASASIPRPLT